MLAGKLAVITGGLGGFGQAFAKDLLSAGAKVALLDLSPEKAPTILEQLTKGMEPSRAVFVQCDVSKTSTIAGAFQAAEEAAKTKMSIVCNNAGIATFGYDRMEAAVAINLTAVMEGTRIGHEQMRGRGGVIINSASIAGLIPVSMIPVYCATKAAVIHYTRSCGALVKDGVRVNAICPAFADTPMVAGIQKVPGAVKLVNSLGIMPVESVSKVVMDLIQDPKAVAKIMEITAGGVREV